MSNTADPTVLSRSATAGPVTVAGAAVAVSDRSGTELRIRTEASDSTENGQLVVRICRILRPDGSSPADETEQPCLSANWRLPDGTRARGTLATALFALSPL